MKSEARSKLLKKLKSIDSYENFPIAIDTCLETEEECQYMLNAIESGLVENSVDITMLATTIDDERKKKDKTDSHRRRCRRRRRSRCDPKHGQYQDRRCRIERQFRHVAF